MVATLESHKDHDTLLRAFAEVVARIPRASLRLAGEGSLRGALDNVISEVGIAANVEFLGSRRDLPALMRESDVFVFSTTRREGFGTVLIEALAAGIPIVASDVPACREALEGGKWGILVPPNDPKALAEAMSHALAWQNTKSGLDEYLRRFSPERMIAGYLKMWN